MKLWIDDERQAPNGFIWAKTADEAIAILKKCKAHGNEAFEIAAFDHDLGWNESGDFTSRPVLKWIIENNYWPKAIRFHTANPIGHKWLRLLARDEAPDWCYIDERDPWQYGWDVQREFGLLTKYGE